MRILSANEIREVENKAFEKYFTEAELMKAAGKKCADKIIYTYGEELANRTVYVVCGNGKNAGDGFVIAKILKQFGANSEIVLADKEPTIEEPLKYFDEAEAFGVPVEQFSDVNMADADFIVDCIFGIGFHGVANEPFLSAFKEINKAEAKVICIDTPSGVDSTNGSVEGEAIKADLTIAISTLKYAHVLPPANEYCGKTVVVNIGIPEDCYENNYANTITKKDIQNNFEKRKKNSNKGNFGRELNICGSMKMPGAAVIAAKGAIKTGVGLLKCAFPKSAYPALTSHMIEPLFLPLSENEEKTFSIGALNNIFEELKWADAVLIGCGMGLNDDTILITNQVLKETKIPLVIDADGINALSTNIEILKDIKVPVILTPHPGEMGRLIGESVEYVQNNRIACAKTFAKEYGVLVILKGANTVVTDGENVFVNTNGNPGMSMGGTGDMLAGMITSFVAQGMEMLDAAKTAVFIHGRCGDICRNEISECGMTVSDMLELLGALMSEFEK